jgi:hypothetical protein
MTREITPNGTQAKEIVLHFIAKTSGENANRGDIARWTTMAKDLLLTYSNRDIISVINHCVDVKKLSLYSFGFITRAIGDVMMEMEAIKAKEAAKQYVKDVASSMNVPREEVRRDEDAAERNRRKASGFGIQSRLRAQYSFDMHEGTDQAD